MGTFLAGTKKIPSGIYEDGGEIGRAPRRETET